MKTVVEILKELYFHGRGFLLFLAGGLRALSEHFNVVCIAQLITRVKTDIAIHVAIITPLFS